MNRPIKLALVFGIMLLVAFAGFVSIRDVSAGNESLDVSASQGLAFQPPPPPVTYTLTINVTPSGSGSVTRTPDRTDYLSGTVVSLLAVPAAGFQFSGWSGDVTGSANPTNITMVDNNKTVTATFTALPSFTLTVNTVGNGSVSKNPNQATYTSGSNVQLTATAATGWQFSVWSGDLTGSTNPANITMSANRVVTATFTQLPCYTLTIVRNPSGGGNVSANPTPNCNSATQYFSGASVALTASANSGYNFSSWSNCDSPSGATCTMSMSSNKSVTANFTQVSAPPAQPTATATTQPPSQPPATITPLIPGGVATATSTPRPATALPDTGGSPLGLLAAGLVLALIFIGARALRQNTI